MRDRVDVAQIISWNGRPYHWFTCHNFNHRRISLQITENLTTWAQSKARNRIPKLGSTGSPTKRGYNSTPTFRSRSSTGIIPRFITTRYSCGVDRTLKRQTRVTTAFPVRIIGSWWGFRCFNGNRGTRPDTRVFLFIGR